MSKLPTKTGGRSKYGGSGGLTRDEVRARVGGINPYSLLPDSEEKFELFEKIRKFYVLYTDGARIREGLGDILEWTSSYGVDELNKRLMRIYKFDLEAVNEHLKDDAILFQKKNYVNRTLGKKGAVKSSMKSVAVSANTLRNQEDASAYVLQSSGAGQPSEDAIRQKLIEFYRKHDPSMLDNEGRVDNVVQYAVQKGVQKLNLKLQKKFHTSDVLEFQDDDTFADNSQVSLNKSIPSGSAGKPAKSFSTLLREAEKHKTRGRSKTGNSIGLPPSPQHPGAGMLSVAGSRRILPSIARDFDNRTRLPPQLKLFLKMYYSCYDPVYIVRDKLQGAKIYAEEVGMEKFDESLQTKYKESLSDFQGRVELLQDKLQNFYLSVDLKRTNDALMSVLQWTLRHGELSLNRGLRRKYGVDLGNYDSPTNEEPEPLTAPDAEPEF